MNHRGNATNGKQSGDSKKILRMQQISKATSVWTALGLLSTEA